MFTLFTITARILAPLAVAAALTAGMIPNGAHAATSGSPAAMSGDLAGIETTAHGVVVSSSLPHCLYEDGGPVVPCTWNVGPGTDGNGRGLAYIVRDHRGVDSSFDYVWNTDPTRNGWHWSRVDNDCVVRAGRYRCPDGARGHVTGIPARTIGGRA